MNSSSFEPGEIVIATLLFAEQVGAKKRPALVISNEKYNRASEDIILLKITSSGSGTEYDVPLSQKDLVEGTITVDSQIMVDNPVTTYKQLIERKIGRVSKQKLAEVKQKMRELFGL